MEVSRSLSSGLKMGLVLAWIEHSVELSNKYGRKYCLYSYATNN